MAALKGKIKKLFTRLCQHQTLYHADLTEQELGRMHELIRRGLVNQYGSVQGRVYRLARATTYPDLRGGGVSENVVRQAPQSYLRK